MLSVKRRKGLGKKIIKPDKNKKVAKPNETCKIIFKKINKKARSKATTTVLIQSIFKTFFPNHLDKTDPEVLAKKQKCGVCECCQLPDCGECRACYSMRKFGGDGSYGRVCGRRLCPNMDVEDSEGSELDENDQEMPDESVAIPVNLTGKNCRRIKWIGEPVKVDDKKIYYETVSIEGVQYKLGDYVMVEAATATFPPVVTRLRYMWKDVQNKNGYFHCEAYVRASDTILGEAGNPREVFLVDQCCHGVPLSSILRKANVEKRDSLQVFNIRENKFNEELLEDDGITFYYQKYYKTFIGRFTDLPIDPECPNVHRKHRFCPSCERKQVQYINLFPRVSGRFTVNSDGVPEPNRIEFTSVEWQGNEYKKGCAVFLRVRTFKLKNSLRRKRGPKIKRIVDEKIYTEFYRKRNSKLGGMNRMTKGSPFYVGYVENVTVALNPTCHDALIPPQKIYLRVRILYRPENTTCTSPQNEDLNMVFWSNEIREIPFLAVIGPCELVYVDNIPQQENSSISDWLEMDPCRMYFRQSYSPASGEFSCVPPEAKLVGLRVESQDKTRWKGKGKGKGKSNKSINSRVVQEEGIKPLKTMDVFSGCGGLSEGLHRSGVADCKWAIEHWEAAAHAFLLNNKDCTVFNEDCNVLLKDALAGATHSKDGLRIPSPGEVELVCGGPPCQGFSVLNRFNKSDYSIFMNSLVVSFLAYCDYYRPKYIVMENVRNFAVYQRGMVLKLTIRALLAMGYQCAIQILQAGCYGIPQARRRFILLAAAPGYLLPNFPEPSNVFYKNACAQHIMIDEKRFRCDLRWRANGPRRSVTTRDALSDLPRISNNSEKFEMAYSSKAETYFQRLVRGNNDKAKLRDHVCKKMSLLNQARIRRIPTTPGSDWRDLPNKSVKLSDGTKAKKLEYRHRVKKKGRAVRGPARGVCACAAGRPCSREDRQLNTLIPWCLPHTGKRHGQFKGVLGRIAWDGYFSTTVTDPEPMGKQGRVLHPEQHRVVSVRETARSQGFPDSFIFAGSLADKYRQIGNAVPPPLAAALGREIKKALIAREKKKI